jgi:hypothetical protein
MASLAPVGGQANLLLSTPDLDPDTGAASGVEVAPRPGRGFIASWRESLPAGQDPDGGSTLMLRLFGPDGTPLGPPRPAAGTDLDAGQAELVPLGGGKAALAFASGEMVNGKVYGRVHARVLDLATGDAVGPGHLLAEGFNRQSVGVLALPDGRAGVLWKDVGDPGLWAPPEVPLHLSILGSDGMLAGTVTLRPTDPPYPDYALLGGVALSGPNAGIIAVRGHAPRVSSVHEGASGIEFFHLDGTPAALPRLAGGSGRMVALPDGGLAFIGSYTRSGYGWASVGRLDAAMQPVGTVVTVRFESGAELRDVAPLPDGGLVLVATRGIPQPDIWAVHVPPAGGPAGQVFTIDLPGEAMFPQLSIAATGAGEVVLGWTYAQVGGRDDGIRATRLALVPGAPPPAGGAEAADHLAGTDGADRLSGGGGDDLIRGAGGADSLDGGDGSDRLFGGGGDDLLEAGAGAGDDTLRGGDGADTLRGAFGADRLEGEAGADSLAGGEGDDRLFGGAGADTLDDGLGADTLRGGAEEDRLLGGDGGDRLDGEGGNDKLRGGAGDDTLSGAAGQDSLFGGSGDDLLEGGPGDDRLYAGEGADALRGGDGADRLQGEAGNDSLAGGAGADRLFGDGDADTLAGGDGADTLRGGAGADVYFVLALSESAPDTPDFIGDFTRGLDRLDLRALDAVPATPEDDAFAVIGTAGFDGGAGVAQLRQWQDAGLRRTVVALDTGDDDALPDLVLVVDGAGWLAAPDLLL